MANRHLIAILVRLMINSTIMDCIKQAQVDDELPELCLTHGTSSDLVRDTDQLYCLTGWLYVLNLLAHLVLYEDIFHEAHRSTFTLHSAQ